MSRREDNFIHFCKCYFSGYLPAMGIEVINHNDTSHGTLEGVKRYYIANILHEGQELTVTIDLEELNNATSMHNTLEILNKHTYNCIFMYEMDTHSTKDIDDFFKLMYF